MNDSDLFQSRSNVSRETFERLELYTALLKDWNPRINLVSPKSLESLWTRHMLDSMQLAELAPIHKTWVDLGSGGGFPGAVIAIVLPKTRVTLVESDHRKCAFLRAVARQTVPFRVLPERIEAAMPLGADVVSARALAPLSALLAHAKRHLAPGGRALFSKGKNARQEVTEALEHWRFDCETYPSKTDEEAVILSIGDIERV